MILACTHGHEWVSEEEDDEEPCPYCEKDREAAAQEAFWERQDEERRTQQDADLGPDRRTLAYWDRLM